MIEHGHGRALLLHRLTCIDTARLSPILGLLLLNSVLRISDLGLCLSLCLGIAYLCLFARGHHLLHVRLVELASLTVVDLVGVGHVCHAHGHVVGIWIALIVVVAIIIARWHYQLARILQFHGIRLLSQESREVNVLSGG